MAVKKSVKPTTSKVTRSPRKTPSPKGTVAKKSPAKKPAKKPETSEEPKPEPMLWSMQGELEIVSGPRIPMVGNTDKSSFLTPNMSMDKSGVMYQRSTLILMVDGKQVIAPLTSDKVKLILNLLEVLPYAPI